MSRTLRTCVLSGKSNFSPVLAVPQPPDLQNMKTIVRSVRLSFALLSGATMLCAGSLTKECSKDGKQGSKSICEVDLGRNDAWLKENSTWNQSGSMFSPRYSALLAEKQVKLDEKTVIPVSNEPVAISLN